MSTISAIQGETLRLPTFTFDPSSATFLKALPLSKNVAVISATVGRIEQLLEDPLNLQPKMLKSRPDLQQEIETNQLIQRLFDGKKRSNVKAYASYLQQLVLGERTGASPPIHLWTPDLLEFTAAESPTEQQYVLAKPDTTFLAIDGQTQLASYFELLRTATPELKKILRNYTVACVLHHGIDVFDARQLFYDLNVLGVSVNTAQGLGMNTIDPLMKIVRYLEDTIPALNGRVEKAARQIKKDSPMLMTIQTLRQMVVNIAKGISGVQYGAKPVPMDDLNVDYLQVLSKEFLEAFLAAFELNDRNNSVLPAAATLAAIAALVHPLFEDMESRGDVARRATRIQEIIANLRDVDWAKTAKWNGIAGKSTDKGLAVGGPKEVGYNIYNALMGTNPEQRRQISKGASAATLGGQ